MIGSIPCPIILNNIILGEMSTHKKNNNLVLTQVSTQHPFICATNVLGERKQNLVCHIWALLAPHHPCMANVIRVIRPIGDMNAKDQCGFFNI
jgi:hypothetical protein